MDAVGHLEGALGDGLVAPSRFAFLPVRLLAGVLHLVRPMPVAGNFWRSGVLAFWRSGSSVAAKDEWWYSAGARTSVTMATAQTAISLDALLLSQIDAAAEELGVPRSGLLARAVEEFLRRHRNEKLLAALNQAHADGPTEDEVELRQALKRRQRSRLQGEW